MIFAPVVTRLYGAEAYGQQGVFMSIVGLIGVVATLGYPTAIVLPKSDADAFNLARLAVAVSFIAALTTTLVLAAWGELLLKLLNAEAIYAFMYLIPIAVLVMALSSVLGQCLIRKRAFGIAAKYGVLTTLFTNLTKAGLGILHPTALVLVLTNTLGALLGAVITFVCWRKQQADGIVAPEAPSSKPTSVLDLVIAHRDFPLLRTPQNLINALSQSLPVLLLASYFGPSSAAQYTIALAVLGAPAMLIGNSVMSVFYPRITEAIRNGEDARALIVKATASMAAVGALPYFVVMVAGPDMFALVFGEEWHIAGTYAQWLSAWLFLQFINKPAVAAIPALRLQGGLLIYELFSTGTKIAALCLGFYLFADDVAAVALFSAFGVVAYAWLILWVISRSGALNLSPTVNA